MTVFANGLEVSAQAQNCKVIAAFPDVCFTPPLTPATPPGVPIPYPNFGMDSDLASGSGTVKIGGKPVSQENASHYKKISGDEAGAAPKKSVITSKNMGKAYAQMWSMDVKVEGKGVVRFSDIMTTNHASNVGSSPPWPAIAKFSPNNLDCETVLVEFKLHRHADKKCPPGHESEHFVQNEYLQWQRGKETASQFENYKLEDAPCICMEAYKKGPGGKYRTGSGSKEGSPHHAKTLQCNNAIRNRTTTPTLGESVDDCTKAVVDNDPRTKNNDKKKEEVMECLKAAFMEYLDRAVKEKDPNRSAEEAAQEPIAWEVSSSTDQIWLRE